MTNNNINENIVDLMKFVARGLAKLEYTGNTISCVWYAKQITGNDANAAIILVGLYICWFDEKIFHIKNHIYSYITWYNRTYLVLIWPGTTSNA